MGKRRSGKARATDVQHTNTANYDALASLAARHGRRLHDVPRDGQCLLHAILHCLAVQGDSRAEEYTAQSLRLAIVELLSDPALQDRAWVGACDQDRVSLTNLRATLASNAARYKNRSLHEWQQAMRNPTEFGDANMLIGAVLLFKRRIIVLSATSDVVRVDVPEIFGEDFRPSGDDLWLAVEEDVHYYSTRTLMPNGSPYQRPPNAQRNLTQQDPPPRIRSPGDDRVAELHTITSGGKPFKEWINDKYKTVCMAFSSSALKGTLYNGMQRAVRYQRIVEAVRSDLHGAAVLAHVHKIAQEDILSRRTEQRHANASLSATDRARNSQQRRQHRAGNIEARDAEAERDREAHRSSAKTRCASIYAPNSKLIHVHALLHYLYTEPIVIHAADLQLPSMQPSHYQNDFTFLITHMSHDIYTGTMRCGMPTTTKDSSASEICTCRVHCCLSGRGCQTWDLSEVLAATLRAVVVAHGPSRENSRTAAYQTQRLQQSLLSCRQRSICVRRKNCSVLSACSTAMTP